MARAITEFIVAWIAILFFTASIDALASSDKLLDVNLSKDSLIEYSVTGTLFCSMGTKNTGSPCRMRIQEDETGRIYYFKGSVALYSLYFDGVTHVEIKAVNKKKNKLIAGGAIQVTQVAPIQEASTDPSVIALNNMTSNTNRGIPNSNLEE